MLHRIPFADPSNVVSPRPRCWRTGRRREGVIIDDVKVQLGVLVVVEKDAAPCHLDRPTSCLANGGVGPVAVVQEQLAGGVGDVEVVAVMVGAASTPMQLLVVNPTRALREAALAVVAEKLNDLVPSWVT